VINGFTSAKTASDPSFPGITYSYATTFSQWLDIGAASVGGSLNNGIPFVGSVQMDSHISFDVTIVRPGQQPPVARIVAPQTIALNSPVLLDGSQSTDPDGNIVEYRWDVQNSAGGVDSFRGPAFPYAQIPYTWTSPGSYSVTLVVTDNEGQTGATTTSVSVALVTDSDGDHVPDDVDQCPGTTLGDPVDADGCSASQRDSDGDGVTDNLDRCLNTPTGTPVDEHGCPIVFTLTLSGPPSSVPTDRNLNRIKTVTYVAYLEGPHGQVAGSSISLRLVPTQLSGSGHAHFDPANPPLAAEPGAQPTFGDWVTTNRCDISNVSDAPDDREAGTCEIELVVPEVSGTYEIGAAAEGVPGQPKATPRELEVAFPDLEELTASASEPFVLVGQYESKNCAGTPVSSQHRDNHFGSMRFNTHLRAIATVFASQTSRKLRINDISLRAGGVFDTENDFSGRVHVAHREGVNVDIDLWVMDAASCERMNSADLADLQQIVLSVTGQRLIREGDHIHLNRPLR